MCKVLAEDSINITHAFLALNEETCRRLLSLRRYAVELEKTLGGFYCIELSSHLVRYGQIDCELDYEDDNVVDLLQRNLSRIFDSGAWMALPIDPLGENSDLLNADGELPNEGEVSCTFLRVKPDGVLWTAQNSDNSFKTLETETLFWTQLESALNECGKLLIETCN